MLPFSKRPPPPDEFFLRSGDFEAIEVEEMQTVVPPMPQPPRQVWNRTAPRAPERRTPLPPVSTPALRSPRSSGRHGALPAANPPPRSMMPTLSAEEAFRPATPAPARHVMPVQTMQPAAPAHTIPPAYRPVPVPPNTLSPVAMSAHVPYSHSHFTSSVTPLPIARPTSKPNFMLGLTIAIAGAVLGSVLGVGVNAKKAAAEVVPQVQAAAAVLDGQSSRPLAPSDSLPPAHGTPSRPTQAPAVVAGGVASAVARVAEQPPIVVTTAAKVEAPKAKVAVAAPASAPAPVAAAPTHKVATAPVAAPPPATPVPAAKAPVHVAAVPAPPPAPAAKPAPVAKVAPPPVEKPAKAEKPEKAEKNKDADDALKLYKAANDETNLTLGGSK